MKLAFLNIQQASLTCDISAFNSVQVVCVSLFQVVMAWAVRDMEWWKVMLASYVLAGTASQNLFTAQHELSHFLAFRKPLYNRILSIASNCPLVIPMATSFRKYHQEHHSHLVSLLFPLLLAPPETHRQT